ncbi:hypothetical protein FD754_010670, partial [Muntiacus muntjak]
GGRPTKKKELSGVKFHMKGSAVCPGMFKKTSRDGMEKSHKFPAVVHMAHQKPRPALEKVTPLKRIYIIQQPRKC